MGPNQGHIPVCFGLKRDASDTEVEDTDSCLLGQANLVPTQLAAPGGTGPTFSKQEQTALTRRGKEEGEEEGEAEGERTNGVYEECPPKAFITFPPPRSPEGVGWLFPVYLALSGPQPHPVTPGLPSWSLSPPSSYSAGPLPQAEFLHWLSPVHLSNKKSHSYFWHFWGLSTSLKMLAQTQAYLKPSYVTVTLKSSGGRSSLPEW